ncbi:MAG: DUF401 family protein [Firmicutes bacterium]|jgi:integral membrane protein (TIGR00529 family)|nr:DUF401 family protein [Bacillota bacterium]
MVVDLVKVLVVLILVLVLLSRKLNLGAVMVLAGALLGVLFGFGPGRIATVAFRSVTSQSTFNILAAMVFVVFLEALMDHGRMLERVISSLGVLVRDRRITMAVLPAFIGLLPSAGGALISCPMVEGTSRDMELSPERKAVANFWFRHIMEYAVPVYPAMFLASEILGVPVRTLMLAMLPLAVISSVVIIPTVYRGVPRSAALQPRTDGVSTGTALAGLLVGVSPVLFALFFVVGLGWHMSAGSAIACAVLLPVVRPSWADLRRMIAKALSPRIGLLVLGIMFFKDMLAATSAVDGITSFLLASGAPTLLIVIVLPILIGFLTGLSSAFVGVAFPIIAGLVGAGGGPDIRLAAVAYVSGIAGMKFTPMHLCLVLTVEYFKADFARVVRMMLCPEALIVTASVLLYITL